MSVIKHMMDKTASLRSASDIESSSVKKSSGPVTAPGMMAQLTGAQNRIKELEAKVASEPRSGDERLSLAVLAPNPWQPRKRFRPDALNSLALSVKEQGVIQPIIVRPNPSKPGEYQIVAGERRYRVSLQLELPDIPARIVELTDEDMAIWALSENLNREDLTDFEISRGIKDVQAAFDAKSRLAEALGMSRSQLYRYLAYDDLPTFILADLETDPGSLTVTYVDQLAKILKDEALSDEVLKETWQAFFTQKFSQDELVSKLRKATTLRPQTSAKPEEPRAQELVKAGKKVGRIHDNGKVLTFKIQLTALSQTKQERLKKFVEDLLK